MKEYEGTCYIGVVGPDDVPTTAAMSILSILRREGDSQAIFYTATKGYVARQEHINKFMDSEHDFILLLDHDMVFEQDTLERLRNHKRPFVSGYYMRRQYAPIYSVWFYPFSGKWPYEPYLEEPESGRLVPLGASGWGCILVHREVIEETRKILKGELDVLEDDMDVWPYDLQKVLAGEEEIRPLRALKEDIIGSDIRFPFYAKAAGYQLYGDPDVRPKHVVNYPLSPDDFSGQSLRALSELRQVSKETIKEKRAKVLEAQLMAQGGTIR